MLGVESVAKEGSPKCFAPMFIIEVFEVKLADVFEQVVEV